MKNYSLFMMKSFEFLKKDFLVLLFVLFFLIAIGSLALNPHPLFLLFLMTILGFIGYHVYKNFSQCIILEYNFMQNFLVSIIFLIVFPVLTFSYGYLFMDSFNPSLIGLQTIYYSFTFIFVAWMTGPVLQALRYKKSAHYNLAGLILDVYTLANKFPELTYVADQIADTRNVYDNKVRVGSFVFSLNQTFWNDTPINHKSLVDYSTQFGIPLNSIQEEDIEMIKMMSI